MQRKALSLILILCLLLDVLPNSLAAPAAAAERSPLVLQVVKEGVDENDDGGLLKALKDVERLGPAYGVATIEIGSDITLTKPAVFPSNIDIILRSVTGKHYTIRASETFDKAKGLELFQVPSYDTYNDHGAIVQITDVTLDGNGLIRSLLVGRNSQVILGRYEASKNMNTTLCNGYVSGVSTNGGAFRAEPGSRVYAVNVLFENNTAELGNGTGGGAIYLNAAAAFLRQCTFKGNKAHSGGAIYAFGGNTSRTINGCTVIGMPLLMDSCIFGQGNEERNMADQRGGAIHCHGNALIRNTEIVGQHSNQNGGAIYISSQLGGSGVQGKLLLQNSKVTGNTANGNGAGIYIADGGTLYLYGDQTTVSQNRIQDDSVPTPFQSSNVFYSGSNCKIVATSKVSTLQKDENGKPLSNGIGISTANPFTRKLAVYSAKELSGIGGEMDALDNLIESVKALGWEWPEALVDTRSYSMANDHDQYKNYFYDSMVWRLVTKRFSTPDAELNKLFDASDKVADTEKQYIKEGNMWLNLDPDYIEQNNGGETIIKNQPYVVFDYNLPGAGADVYPSSRTIPNIKKGDKVTAPEAHDEYKSGASFIFLGWSAQPSGGKTFPPGTQVEVTDEHKVYYAQWDIIIPDPVLLPDLFTVFFDYNYDGGGVTSALVGTFDFSTTVTVSARGSSAAGSVSATTTETIIRKVTIPFVAPTPSRQGYYFRGWATSPTALSGSNPPTPPKTSTTYYATWEAKPCKIIWDANGGATTAEVNQRYDDELILPTQPTRTGYTFVEWCLDKACSIPLVSGTKVKGDATYYAHWTPNEYTITWDANYTGGTITTVKQHHDEKLNILPIPTRDGYVFGGWYTGNTKAESYGKVREDVTFTARWTNIAQTYTVTVEWDDQSNNDNVRPEEITVALLANGIPTGLSYTLDDSDADTTGNKWSYTFGGLDVTDAVSNPITYSVAITSTVSDQYSYGIENKSAELGYILMTHSLITRDVDTYVVWDDNNDQDGIRPATVSVRLYANGEAVDDDEAKVALSGSGNTWFYQFRDVQKYYTDTQGRKGQQISYTLEATPTNSGELNGYDIEYRDYTIILRHRPATVSRTVHVEWQDSNNQDGKRPVNMAVQLYADNVPLEGKTVQLSAANNWTYTWDNLSKYTNGGREVVYSARVTSTLVDYTAKSTGMTIEMTYVPSSTSISAFVTWTDEQDADGLRPDFITAQLVADGKPTGDSQVLSATTGWTVNWNNYPIYKNGDRIEYTFQVDVPDGYEATYHGVYDTSGLSAVLTHARLKQSLTGHIVWEDKDNQSGGRMGKVAVLLYADGSVIDEDDKVWISAEDGWEHTFSDLPIFRDHGEEIKYSMVLVSDPGKYVATTSKMTITMNLEPEFVDVPFEVIWDDNNNSDGVRPNDVRAVLLVDGQPSGKTQIITAKTDWTTTFTHLDYSGPSGVYRYRVELDEIPEGYIAKEADNVVVLKRVAETKDVTATVTWHDNNNQYRERPEQITLTLYADRLDGNGPQNTGRIAKCKGTDGWTYTFEGVPAFYQGKNIIYSVEASGDLPNYTASYDGMEVYMTHKSYSPDPVTTQYDAKVVWLDGHNAKSSRPYNLLVTLYADGKSYGTYTMTEADLDATGYTWLHTFADLPTKVDGKNVAYTIGVTEPVHYIAQTQGNTITMTHVMDIPILVRWHDQRDNDGVRPETLTLELFGDSVKTDTAISLTGAHNAETWRGNFRQIPVWSETQMDREIVYTWAFAGNSLAGSDYTVEYNEFTVATVGNEDLYPIDINRPGDVMDVSVFLKWDDGNDRDGLRLASDTEVMLFADGKATGKVLKLTGSNEAESWTGTFEDLPVWNDGNRIVYSMDVASKEGYTASYNHTTPFNATLTHAPAEAEVKANVEWDKTVKDKFDIAAELLVDGEGTGRIGVLDAENGYEESWGIQYVYRDHGQRVDYTVCVAEQTKIPEWHVVEAQGLTITVKRVKFELTGRVLNDAKNEEDRQPIPTALVTLKDLKADKILGQVFTDAEGRYAFTVGSGDYCVQAHISLPWASKEQQISIEDLNFDTNADIIFSDQIPLCECTIMVKKYNGDAAPHAAVDVDRPSQGYATTLITDETGTCKVVLPHGNYHFQASFTNEQGDCYRAALDSPFFYGSQQTFTITLPPEGTGQISGTVLDATGTPVSNIVVQCYVRSSGSFVGAETRTDENGNFTIGGLSDATYELIIKDQSGKTIPLSENIYFTLPKDAGTKLNIRLPRDYGEDPPQSGSGTLSGIALDNAGHPVGDAKVLVTDKATGRHVSVLTTTPEGSFEIQLPTGEYTVEIQKQYDNNTDQSIRVDNEAASQEDGPVTANSFTISGYALDEGGQPMEGVTVYLYGEDGQLLATASLVETEETALEDAAADLFAEDGFIRLDERVTAEDGKYVFKGLRAGRYVVKIAQGIGGNGGSTDIPVTVQPLPEIPDGADLTVTTDSYTVSGMVMGKAGVPVGNASVTLLDDQDEEVARMTTGADGVYVFANLSEGDYTVNISYPDSDLLASGDVTITDGGFTAFPGQTVSGKIKDTKGNALPNVTVTLRGEDGKTYTATTDKDGSYRVVVPDGKYTVEVNINGKTASKTITVNGKAVTADLTITLSDGGSTTPGGNTPGGSGGGSGSGGSGGNIGGGGFIPDPDPTENQTYVLSGTVTDKDGNPVEGANITATDAKSGKTYTDTTGADGKYALAVPKGSYTITISYGSVSSNPKKVSVSKDSSLDAIPMDSLGKLVLAYVNGYADGTFGGERHITRSEVAALISRVSEGFDKGKSYGVAFKDVPDGVWYANNLGYCVEAGLIQGRGNGMFDPNANITRAEFAAIVARFLGLPNEVVDTKVSYTDTSGNWADGYIAQLTVKGIVDGKGDGKFDPNAVITRYEAVTMLNRALERTPDKAALDALAANRTIRPFPDLHPTHWAYHQVLEAAFDHYHK